MSGMNVDYHELAGFINRHLPGSGVWLQSASEAPENSDTSSSSKASEGLAIRRLEGYWLVVYFSVLTTSTDTDDLSDDSLGVEDLADLTLEIGFTGEYDTLGEAKEEARSLVEYLPSPAFMDRGISQRMIFSAIDDLEDDPDEGLEDDPEWT